MYKLVSIPTPGESGINTSLTIRLSWVITEISVTFAQSLIAIAFEVADGTVDCARIRSITGALQESVRNGNERSKAERVALVQATHTNGAEGRDIVAGNRIDFIQRATLVAASTTSFGGDCLARNRGNGVS